MPEEQKLRCLNCYVRITVPPKTQKLTCPKCGVEYVIAWRGSQAKIAGPAKK
jgi:predicted RNA-binding Zn-ribbon protein involved in translation (DUF1610 family)